MHATEGGVRQTPRSAVAEWDDARRRDDAEEFRATSCLDPKTRALAYLAVVAAMRMEAGLPTHVARAKLAGASREEVVSAIMVGVSVAGVSILRMIPAAIGAYDEPYRRGQE
jgi:alkylhydroperoxidase/carboxymuconolactone decarboxylase family protein YurZ